MIEDEIVGHHGQLDGHEFVQALGVGDGQGSLACCSPWGHNALDVTELLNNNKVLKGQVAGVACAGGLPQLERV